MIRSCLWRNTLIWLGLLVLGFANGTLRELVIKPWIAEPWAHHLSVLTAILLFSAYVGAIWKKTQIQDTRAAAWIGVYWFVLTVLTETFLLNRWMSGLAWDQILESYNIAHAQLWPLVLVWVGVLPWVMLHVKGPARA